MDRAASQPSKFKAFWPLAKITRRPHVPSFTIRRSIDQHPQMNLNGGRDCGDLGLACFWKRLKQVMRLYPLFVVEARVAPFMQCAAPAQGPSSLACRFERCSTVAVIDSQQELVVLALRWIL